MEQPPKISVCMCFFNTDPAYLRAAVESVLAQTFTDFELIILDDGSSDPRPAAALAEYTDPRIVRLTNTQNQGIPAGRNRMLEAARGEFIAVLDSDDLAVPERFAKQLAFFAAHPEVGVCGGAAEFFPPRRVKYFPETDAEIRKEMFIRCPFLHSAVMLRASLVREQGFRYPLRAVAEDYGLWTKMFAATRFHNLPDVLVRYRRAGQNITARRSSADVKEMYGVQLELRREQRETWELLFQVMPQISWVKLGGWLPFLKIKRQMSHTKVYLFGVIPILTIEAQP